jgi:hypothetical protein
MTSSFADDDCVAGSVDIRSLGQLCTDRLRRRETTGFAILRNAVPCVFARLSKFLHSSSSDRLDVHTKPGAGRNERRVPATGCSDRDDDGNNDNNDGKTTGPRTRRRHGGCNAPFRDACDKSVERSRDYLKSDGTLGISDRFVTP